MSIFKDADYYDYGDREDPEVNIRYFLNNVILILDDTKSESDLLKYDIHRLGKLYTGLCSKALQEARKALINPELRPNISRKLKEIVRLKRTIQPSIDSNSEYPNLYSSFDETTKRISNEYRRTLALMRNTSIKP